MRVVLLFAQRLLPLLTSSSSLVHTVFVGQEPTVVGKPAPLMIDFVMKQLGLSDASRIAMIGDRLDTDIVFGRDNGLKTCLVLSGVTSEEKLLSPDNKVAPDFYCDSIKDFY